MIVAGHSADEPPTLSSLSASGTELPLHPSWNNKSPIPKPLTVRGA